MGTKLTAKDIEALFNESIDDNFPEVELPNVDHSPSYVFKELHPNAYARELTKWIASQLEDGMFIELNGSYSLAA